jgi:hypothetical protein
VIATAKENKLNPFEYLVHLFEQMPNVDVKNPVVLQKLLPWNVVLPEKPAKQPALLQKSDVWKKTLTIRFWSLS